MLVDDDTARQRQALPGAAPHLLGREELVEHPRPYRLGNATPRIADRDRDPIAVQSCLYPDSSLHTANLHHRCDGVRGIDLAKNDYVVGVAVTPKVHESGEYRILAITENGFGKRTDVEEYRLQSRGGKGVKNMAVTPRIGRVSSIQLVEDSSELMVISQFGKIIRIDTKTIRAAGRATQGVRLLNLEPEDKVAAAVIIPPEELKDDEPTLLQ